MVAVIIIFASVVAVVFMLTALRAFTKEARQHVRRRGERKNNSLTMDVLERYRGRDRAA
jgi:hypothetical protein